MQKERTVRFSDLLLGIFSHWKGIIVFVIIGALAGAGYSWMTSGNKSKSGENSGVTMTLDQSQKDTISLYVRYADLYDDQLDFIESDNLMQIDPANTFSCSTVYYLGCEEAEKVDGIMQAYNIRLLELADIYGKPNTFTIKKNQNTLITDDFNNIITSEGTNCVISAVVYGTSIQDCSTKMDEVDEYLFEKQKEIEDTFGKHTVTGFRGDISKAPATVIITRQKDAIDTLNNINSSMAGITKNLDADFNAVLQYCADNHREYQNAENIPDKISTNESSGEEGKKASKKVSPKMAGIGAVAGFVIAFIIFAIVYALRSTLVPEDNVEEMFGIPLFVSASSAGRKKKTGLDRLIDRKRRRRLPKVAPEGEADLAASNIRVCCKAGNISRVYATGCRVTEEEKAFLDKVAAELRTDNIELITGKPILVFPEALEESAEIGNIILVEGVGLSRYEEIASEIRKCNDNNIKILGMISAG